jgi:hypothetical protein
VSGGYWSREQRLARLGPELFAQTLKIAAEAPPPTPAQVELIRRIFAPQVKRLLAERTAVDRPARAA